MSRSLFGAPKCKFYVVVGFFDSRSNCIGCHKIKILLLYLATSSIMCIFVPFVSLSFLLLFLFDLLFSFSGTRVCLQVQGLLGLFYSKKVIDQKSLNQNKLNIKYSKSLNEEKLCRTDSKSTSEEGEVKNTVSGTPSHATTASAASSVTGTLSLPLGKGSDHVIIYSSGLEDYIPLSSPDHDDLEETVTTCLEAATLKENQSQSAKGNGCEQLSLCEESIFPKVFGPKDLNRGPVCDGYDKSSPVHEREKNLVVKGLYADTNEKRKCVFSRLNFVAAPPAAKEINDDLQSPDGLMRRLQQFHSKWKKFPTRTEKRNEDRPPKSRDSAFSRLTVAPERAIDKKRKTKPWDKVISENVEMSPPEKKRRQSVFLRLQNNHKKSQVMMTEDLSRAKKLVDPVVANPSNVKCGTCGCLANEQIPSQKDSTGKGKGQSCEEGSTVSKIKNADHDRVSQKDVGPINDNVVEVSPKTLLTYYRRRRHSSGSSVAKELKQSVVADGEDAGKQIVGTEEGVCVKPVLV